jgi:hypothetical protein
MAPAAEPQNSRELMADRPLLADGELTELRRLLFGPEQARLDALQRHLEQIPQAGVETVSEVLPQAIVRRSQQDLQLSHALAPTIEDAIKVSVKRDPRPLVEAIFPVMGPAIRKAIVQALEGMIQSLNASLEYSVSPRGWLWRWEALRTGKPFAEVVLLRTLIYRVEQVFLIHKHTGLLLQHVAGPAATSGDPDMISSMLTAIQDFVHDAFTVRSDEVLDTFRVGRSDPRHSAARDTHRVPGYARCYPCRVRNTAGSLYGRYHALRGDTATPGVLSPDADRHGIQKNVPPAWCPAGPPGMCPGCLGVFEHPRWSTLVPVCASVTG